MYFKFSLKHFCRNENVFNFILLFLYQFSRVFSVLRFYVDILKLDNLWRFAGLVKLQLDNNIIEKIEGLGFLVNLQWLGRYFHHVYLTGRAINCFNILSENFSGVVNTYIVSINEDDFPSHKI